jgi:hypothetical protein
MSAEASLGRPDSSAVPRVERHPRFFLVMSVLMLCIVVAGFAQTLFARPLFDVPAIPGVLYVHGLLMTAWYTLLVVQTSLIAAHRTELHRRLGVAGVVLAVGFVVINSWVVFGFPARVAAGQYSLNFDYEANPNAVLSTFWTDVLTLAAFTGLVTVAIVMRRRSDVHKRLILFASLALLGPAYSRIANLMPSIAMAAAIQLGTFLVLHLAVVVYDALTQRRHFHPATLAALAVVIIGTVANGVLTTSAFGRAFVARLE